MRTSPNAPQATDGRKNRTMLIGLILLSVALAAVAQLTLKHGMNQVAANSGELQLNAAFAEGRR